MKALTVAAAALLIAGPAIGSPINVDGLHIKTRYSAIVEAYGSKVLISIDDKQDGMTMIPRPGASFGAAVGGPDPRRFPEGYWRAIAETFVKPAGCGVPDVGYVGSIVKFYWASFQCPPGVDLRSLVGAQHEALMKGEPLHP